MTFNRAFKSSPGYEECPKCFGWQVRDLTPRDKHGWPTGPCNIVDCDHCTGRGEILVKVDPWARVERQDVKPSEVTIDDAVPIAEGVAVGGSLVQGQSGWQTLQQPSGWPQGTPTHSTEWPKPSGWPV